MKRACIIWSGARLLTIFIHAVLTFFPFVFIVNTSLKSLNEFYHYFWAPVRDPQFENYVDAWRQIRSCLLNSVVVSSASAIGVVAFGSLSAA